MFTHLFILFLASTDKGSTSIVPLAISLTVVPTLVVLISIIAIIMIIFIIAFRRKQKFVAALQHTESRYVVYISIILYCDFRILLIVLLMFKVTVKFEVQVVSITVIIYSCTTKMSLVQYMYR